MRFFKNTLLVIALIIALTYIGSYEEKQDDEKPKREFDAIIKKPSQIIKRIEGQINYRYNKNSR